MIHLSATLYDLIYTWITVLCLIWSAASVDMTVCTACCNLPVGIERVKGNAAKQELPLTADILKGIFKLLNINNTYDASFWAICLVAFFGFFCKSHLLPVSGKLFDPNKQFSRSSFLFYSSGALIKVKWSKTIQFRDRVVSIPSPNIPGSALCPV